MTDPLPTDFPRRILLATTGLSPAVVTETLYALACQRQPAFVPSEIHVITTAEGRHRLTLTLLDPASAILAKFADEFALPELAKALTAERIHVIENEDGAPLSDISSEADNARAADLITAIVRDLTRDPDSALHVSIAGGRKTMGFFLGYALSLFGRAQDRLSHVLVAPPFESHPQFYYPPRTPQVLIDRQNRPVSTKDAHIRLADIPFVRLRAGLPEDMLDGAASYSQTVAGIQCGFPDPQLVIDVPNRRLSCHGVIIANMHPLPFAFYAWLARRRQTLAGGDGATHWSVADARELLTEYRQINDLPPGKLAEQVAALAGGLGAETQEQNKSRINAQLKKALGRTAIPYLIGQMGRLPGTRYTRIGLTLPPEAIRFASVPPPKPEPDTPT